MSSTASAPAARASTPGIVDDEVLAQQRHGHGRAHPAGASDPSKNGRLGQHRDGRRPGARRRPGRGRRAVPRRSTPRDGDRRLHSATTFTRRAAQAGGRTPAVGPRRPLARDASRAAAAARLRRCVARGWRPRWPPAGRAAAHHAAAPRLPTASASSGPAAAPESRGLRAPVDASRTDSARPADEQRGAGVEQHDVAGRARARPRARSRMMARVVRRVAARERIGGRLRQAEVRRMHVEGMDDLPSALRHLRVARGRHLVETVRAVHDPGAGSPEQPQRPRHQLGQLRPRHADDLPGAPPDWSAAPAG